MEHNINKSKRIKNCGGGVERKTGNDGKNIYREKL
jgi:hypothetical protein